MRENNEQFHNPPPLESTEKVKPEQAEIQPSPENKGLFTEAVEKIETSERSMKLLNLMEQGYLPNQDDLHSMDAQLVVAELRKKYPTIEDIQSDLTETVDKQIGVVSQEGWTPEQYQQAAKKKKLQYKREAVQNIVSSLSPVYEKFGAVPSEENKTRIIENLVSTVENVNLQNISSSKRDYVKKNVLAAINQKLSPDEARRIIQTQQAFFEVWRRAFPDSQSDPELESGIQEIKEKSGLALDELKEKFGVPEKETPPEKFELRGEKKEIKYPGMPIDIYLASKHLQIIDVRDDKRWNADYLLIDPATFDQMNPTTGYKGIRENEPFVLGRRNPLRFELPNTVSREHLKLELKGGKLSIEDLGSTNGTILQFEKPKHFSKEQIETKEPSAEKKRVIAEFRKYVKKHKLEIERELQRGRDLDDIFYHDFYNNNIDKLKYRQDDPRVQKLEQEYSATVNSVKEKLLQEARKNRGLMPIDNGYWLYCNVNGGFRNQKALGRFYFNLKPEYVGNFFAQTAEAFKNKDLHSQMKIPLQGDADTFNRLDKMVVYFDADEEQKVLQVLESLYHANPEVFDETGTPRFTAKVKDQEGKNMVGIGFAEEPPFRNESFGTIRAKILAEVYRDAKYSRLSVSDSHFDFESSFRKACMKFQVNPQNPAFNLSRGAEKFTELKRRIKSNPKI